MIPPLTFASACHIKALKPDSLFIYCEQLVLTESQHQTYGKVTHNLNILTFILKTSSLHKYTQVDLGYGTNGLVRKKSHK